MMRGIRRCVAADDGMTLVEIVVAAAILLFIATALLGLVGQTISMSQQAKETNVGNNAVNSYVEWVRSLEFKHVDMVGVGEGSLETTTLVDAEYTTVITPSVDVGANTALKNLTLDVSVTRADGHARTFSTTVVIRNRDQYMTARSPSTDPKIEYVSPTPPDGTPIWEWGSGTWWQDSTGTIRPVKLSVKVSAATGRTIEAVYLQGEQVWDVQDIFDNRAQWAVPTWTISPAFSWDAGQTDILGARQVQEGERSIWAYVQDSTGATSHNIVKLILDNYPPEAVPSPLVHNPAGSATGTLTWPSVMDGTTTAQGYDLVLDRAGSVADVWASATGYSGPNTSLAVTGDAMSRYRAQVRAYSPLHRHTDYGAWTYFITRPKLTGTYVVVKQTTGSPKGWKVTSTLNATPPTFAITDSATYKWYEGTTLLGTTTVPTFPVPVVTAGDPKTYPFPARSYTVVVTVTPAGEGGGSPVSVTSNMVTTAATESGTYTFTEGAW